MYTKILSLSKLSAILLLSFCTAFGQSVEDSENIAVSATLVENDVYIDVSSNVAQFGQLGVPDSGRSIFGIAGPKVSWKAPNGNKWSIQITTTDTGSAAGLTSSNGDSLQLKFNNSNLGAPNDLTLPTEDEFSGEAAVYRPVLSSNDSPANKLLLEFGGNSVEGKELNNAETDFDINFAVGVPSTSAAGVYDATIILELVVLPEGT